MADHQGDAVLVQEFGDALDDLGVLRIAKRRNDGSNHAGAVGGEPPRHQVRHVLQGIDRGEHALARVPRDVLAPFRTLDTVPAPTLACRATSAILTRTLLVPIVADQLEELSIRCPEASRRWA